MQRILRLSILSMLLTAGVARAQTPCHAEYDGNAFSDGVSMGGPNLTLAIQFVAPTSFNATSIQVFTGEGNGQNSLQLWSHDAGLNQPSSVLGSGSWSMSSTNSWQGATLASPVALSVGTTYWLGWAPINNAQASVDTTITGLGQAYRASFDGGQSWFGPFQDSSHWKFRILGSCNAPVSYCTAKVNSLGCTPAIGSLGTPSTTASSGFELRGTHVRNQKIDILLYSLSGRAGLPFQGGYLCLAVPIKRTPPVNSAGTLLPAGDCSGVYSIDMTHIPYIVERLQGELADPFRDVRLKREGLRAAPQGG